MFLLTCKTCVVRHTGSTVRNKPISTKAESDTLTESASRDPLVSVLSRLNVGGVRRMLLIYECR